MSANKHGLLGKNIALATMLTSVYSLPEIDQKQYDQPTSPIGSTCYINILNSDLALTAIIDVYVASVTPVNQVDLIEFNINLPPLSTYIRGPIRISAGESIYIYSDVDVVVRVEGTEGVVLL